MSPEGEYGAFLHPHDQEDALREHSRLVTLGACAAWEGLSAMGASTALSWLDSWDGMRQGARDTAARVAAAACVTREPSWARPGAGVVDAAGALEALERVAQARALPIPARDSLLRAAQEGLVDTPGTVLVDRASADVPALGWDGLPGMLVGGPGKAPTAGTGTISRTLFTALSRGMGEGDKNDPAEVLARSRMLLAALGDPGATTVGAVAQAYGRQCGGTRPAPQGDDGESLARALWQGLLGRAPAVVIALRPLAPDDRPGDSLIAAARAWESSWMARLEEDEARRAAGESLAGGWLAGMVQAATGIPCQIAQCAGMVQAAGAAQADYMRSAHAWARGAGGATPTHRAHHPEINPAPTTFGRNKQWLGTLRPDGTVTLSLAGRAEPTLLTWSARRPASGPTPIVGSDPGEGLCLLDLDGQETPVNAADIERALFTLSSHDGHWRISISIAAPRRRGHHRRGGLGATAMGVYPTGRAIAWSVWSTDPDLDAPAGTDTLPPTSPRTRPARRVSNGAHGADTFATPTAEGLIRTPTGPGAPASSEHIEAATAIASLLGTTAPTAKRGTTRLDLVAWAATAITAAQRSQESLAKDIRSTSPATARKRKAATARWHEHRARLNKAIAIKGRALTAGAAQGLTPARAAEIDDHLRLLANQARATTPHRSRPLDHTPQGLGAAMRARRDNILSQWATTTAKEIISAAKHAGATTIAIPPIPEAWSRAEGTTAEQAQASLIDALAQAAKRQGIHLDTITPDTTTIPATGATGAPVSTMPLARAATTTTGPGWGAWDDPAPPPENWQALTSTARSALEHIKVPTDQEETPNVDIPDTHGPRLAPGDAAYPEPGLDLWSDPIKDTATALTLRGIIDRRTATASNMALAAITRALH